MNSLKFLALVPFAILAAVACGGDNKEKMEPAVPTPDTTAMSTAASMAGTDMAAPVTTAASSAMAAATSMTTAATTAAAASAAAATTAAKGVTSAAAKAVPSAMKK